MTQKIDFWWSQYPYFNGFAAILILPKKFWQGMNFATAIMTNLKITLSCPSHRLLKMTLKIITRKMKCEVGILFPPELTEGQNMAKNSTFRVSLLWEPIAGLRNIGNQCRLQEIMLILQKDSTKNLN